MTYYSNKKTDVHVSDAGKKLYTVRFKWIQKNGTNSAEKWNDATASVTIENNINIPSVTYDTRDVADFEVATVKDALRTDVDLNCNKSNNFSITGIYSSWNNSTKSYKEWATSPDEKIKKQTIGAVAVKEGVWTVILDGSWEMSR